MEKIFTNSYIDNSRKICIIDKKDFEKFHKLKKGIIPKNFIVWTCVPISDVHFLNTITHLIKNGFGNPYVCSVNPIGNGIEVSVGLSLLKNGELSLSKASGELSLSKASGELSLSKASGELSLSKASEKSELEHVLYVLNEYKTGNRNCGVKIAISNSCKKFLETLPMKDYTSNCDTGKCDQREHTANFIISNIKQTKNGFLFTVECDETSLERGERETVDVPETRMNFHVHPKAAYIRHKTQYAWPSSTDYLGYLELGNNTIFHAVITIEGIYILSFTQEWIKRLDEIDRTFVKKHYRIEFNSGFNPSSYVDHVNNIKYLGNPIFHVQFFTYDSNIIFSVFFKKYGNSCLVSQENYELHRMSVK